MSHPGFLLFETFSLGTMGIQRLQVTLEPTAARLHASLAVVAGRTKIISAEPP